MYKYIIISMRPSESHYCGRSCSCYQGGCSLAHTIEQAKDEHEAAKKIAQFEANYRDGDHYHNVITMASFCEFDDYTSEHYTEDSDRWIGDLEQNSIPKEIEVLLSKYREEAYLKKEKEAKEARKLKEKKDREAQKKWQEAEDLRKFEELKKKLGK